MKINDTDIEKSLQGLESRRELWAKFIAIQRTRFMAEVGVWKGDFAAEILMDGVDIEIYYMIDPWANLTDWNKPFNVESEVFNEIYKEMDSKTAFAANKRRILRGRTKEVVGLIENSSLDFAYIDGDHTLRGITVDLIKIWPKIKSGGFIGGDDFTTTPWQHDVKYEPTLVFPFSVYFAEAMNVPITALEHGQFLIQKDECSGFSFNDTTGLYGNLSLNSLLRH
ncbi:MAG: class I SAM-dependent methyltransferase [Rhodoferax sp.]|uniref:class I SAM-dependent methyltransferase n=1 Tax=Rhodoferax sp. TaxID=50421 RepID=UPI003265D553